ncbi:predicted protein [Histoplasma mississippiense (nom. inval.)]|uniref:predicted protein n=1 Tax=Ajellomyces capsulatus (strain NAm1 / WU24) TaxID=2059318 RepID=UPI000157B522|nr:predicted protein [Histoplasma mississippiense (nom. inval.)]EDN02388.1 predicted protein [Histoplasma mississippiense (nom. inval.)]
MTSLADCTEVEWQLQVSKDLFSYREKALALALQNRPKNINKQYLSKQREWQLSNEGLTPCWPMILITDNGKINQLRRLKYAAVMRYKNPLLCTISHLAFYLFYRWNIDPFKPLSYDTQLQWVNRMYAAAGLLSSKKTHLDRSQGFRYAELNGMSEDALFIQEDYQKYTLQIVQALETAVEPQKIQILRVVSVIADQLKNVRQKMIQSIDKWGYENQQLQQKMAQQLADLVDGQITFFIQAVPQSSAAQNSVMNLAAIPSASSLPSSSSTLSRDIVQRSVESEMEMRQSSSNNAESVDLTATLLTSSRTGNGYSLSRTIQSVPDLWREWTTGLGSGPSVQSLEDQRGSWHKGSSKEQMMFCRRKIIINEIRFLLYSVFSHYSWLSYEDNSGWALSLLGLSGPQGPHRILFVADQQLSPFTHSPQSRAVLALPGQDVPFVRGSMTELQVRSHRPSYINAILIQSRGRTEPHACLACRSAHPGLRPFPQNAVACLATLVELVATANGVIMPFAAPYEMGKGWR